jgi:chemotaxis protein histidine kinase CheA
VAAAADGQAAEVEAEEAVAEQVVEQEEPASEQDTEQVAAAADGQAAEVEAEEAVAEQVVAEQVVAEQVVAEQVVAEQVVEQEEPASEQDTEQVAAAAEGQAAEVEAEEAMAEQAEQVSTREAALEQMAVVVGERDEGGLAEEATAPCRLVYLRRSADVLFYWEGAPVLTEDQGKLSLRIVEMVPEEAGPRRVERFVSINSHCGNLAIAPTLEATALRAALGVLCSEQWAPLAVGVEVKRDVEAPRSGFGWLPMDLSLAGDIPGDLVDLRERALRCFES